MAYKDTNDPRAKEANRRGSRRRYARAKLDPILMARKREHQRKYRVGHREEVQVRNLVYRQANLEKILAKGKKYRQEHAETYNAASQRWSRALRDDVLRHYGGDPPSCACCGESAREFLAIDHVDGGGSKQRKALRMHSGTQFLGWLRKNNYPPGFRVLCHNCNSARGFYGACPHEAARGCKQIGLTRFGA